MNTLFKKLWDVKNDEFYGYEEKAIEDGHAVRELFELTAYTIGSVKAARAERDCAAYRKKLRLHYHATVTLLLLSIVATYVYSKYFELKQVLLHVCVLILMSVVRMTIKHYYIERDYSAVTRGLQECVHHEWYATFQTKELVKPEVISDSDWREIFTTANMPKVKVDDNPNIRHGLILVLLIPMVTLIYGLTPLGFFVYMLIVTVVLLWADKITAGVDPSDIQIYLNLTGIISDVAATAPNLVSIKITLNEE